MQSAHAVLTSLIQGTPPPRTLFVPLLATLAAAVAGRDVATFLQDPGRRSLTLRDLARSLPQDAVVADSGSLWDLALAGFAVDHSIWPPRVVSGSLQPPPADLEAAARASPTLETLRRLQGLLSPSSPLAVVLTGPGRFASLTGGSPQEWAQVLVAIAQLALRSGARLLLFHEGPEPPADPEGWHERMAPVVGTVRFWQGAAALLLTGTGAGWEPVLRQCGPEMVVVLEEAAGGKPYPDIPLPPLWGLALRPGEEGPVTRNPPGPALVTTAGDLYGQVPVAELLAAVRRLQTRCHPPA